MHFRLRRAPLLIGAAVMALAGAGRSDACSTPPLVAAVYSPANSEINVPTNAVIDIHVFGDAIPAGIENQFSVWQDQTPVAIQLAQRIDSNVVAYFTSVRLTPCSFCLVAGQRYQVRFGTHVTDPQLSTFNTTSADFGGAPPAPTGAAASVNTSDTHPDGGSDCFTERIRQIRLSVPDLGRPVIYTLKEGTQVISADETSLTGEFYCTGQPHWQGDVSWVVVPGPHTIQLTAVDRVGRASPSVDISFNASCAGPDGGSPDGGGGMGSLPGNDGAVPVQSSSGCSCGTGVSAAIALAGFATLLRARRRRHPSGESEEFDQG